MGSRCVKAARKMLMKLSPGSCDCRRKGGQPRKDLECNARNTALEQENSTEKVIYKVVCHGFRLTKRDDYIFLGQF